MATTNVYDRIAADVQARRDSTPRARALFNRVQDVLDETNDDRKRLDLEVLAGSVAIHLSRGEDVTDEGAAKYEERLRKITGAAA